ncbi:hypothetical protein [Peribacillus kribbensis]|uniref:hypothetical protein n=1 Tax=Peribacillus kribbensis TaxID=356658 RepID=UPI000405D171|nr:hypothetical protein [Peribacillus kribbensis]
MVRRYNLYLAAKSQQEFYSFFFSIGTVLSSWELAKEYDLVDIDGRKPDWWSYYREHDLKERG